MATEITNAFIRDYTGKRKKGAGKVKPKAAPKPKQRPKRGGRRR